MTESNSTQTNQEHVTESTPLPATPNAVPADQFQRQAQREQSPPAQAPAAAQDAPSPPPATAVQVDEAAIEQEVADALGDVSLVDIYEMEESAGAAADAPAAAALSAKELDKTSQGICRGRVVAVSADDVFIDLGGKSQGVLPRNELDADEKVDIGQELDVCIVRYDDKDGLLILSKKTADQRLVWHDLETGALVEARVTGHNKGGLELEMKGIRLFMPASQIDLVRVENFEPFVGQKLVCEVTQVERGDKNVIVSRRNVLQREQEKSLEKLWEELAEGQRRTGIVRNLMDYGAFIDLGGADGLLHIREMSWARIDHPRDLLKEGEQVEVVVIKVDREKRKIGLSLKQTKGDPWATADSSYAQGTRHQVTVTKLMDFGAFAELEPGVEGLIPISEMSWAGRVRHPSDVLSVGTLAEVEIMKLDLPARKISMSMKKVQGNPWSNIADRYQPEQRLQGTVARITDFGAFVTLEPGIDGLIHISELSDKHVATVSEVVQEGQQVEVRILSIDESNRRIALSMKPDQVVEEIPTPDQIAAQQAAGQKQDKRRPRRGGLGWDHMNNGAGLNLGS